MDETPVADAAPPVTSSPPIKSAHTRQHLNMEIISPPINKIKNGGEANDPELLALLKGITSSASATPKMTSKKAPAMIDTFQNAEEEEAELKKELAAISTRKSTSPTSNPKTQAPTKGDLEDASIHAELMKISNTKKSPRVDEKRKKNPPPPVGEFENKEIQEELLAIAEKHNKSPRASDVHAPLPVPTSDAPVATFNSSSPPINAKKSSNSFAGKNGGDANDAELLALLKGISSGSSNDIDKPPSPPATVAPSASHSPVSATTAAAVEPEDSPKDAIPPSPPKLAAKMTAAPAYSAPKSTTPDSFDPSSKNWKQRKQSFERLTSFLSARLQDNTLDTTSLALPVDFEHTNELALDALLPKFLDESNASVLDSILDLTIAYIKVSSSVKKNPSTSKAMTEALLPNAFASSRPTTNKKSKALILDLMARGDGNKNVHQVIHALLEKGLTYKKPKVPLNSIETVQTAALKFGATHLPLQSITTFAKSYLQHTDGRIREFGIEIIAEFCRAFHSKEPVASVFSELKPSQMSQLDALIESKPNPTKPSIELITLSGEIEVAPTSSAEAISLLKEQQEKQERQEFENRAPVNLFDTIKQSEYKNKIKEEKWSIKVAALEILNKCGGEKPYKLVVDSTMSPLYAGLVKELKELLKHSHIAVSGGAMTNLCMLAEGLKEKFYVHAKPLLLTLLEKGKDKKLTTQINQTLDSLFGNCVTLEHVLDAVKETTDPTKNKNALARAVAWDFLQRCVSRGVTAGTRGTLTTSLTTSVMKLSIDVLQKEGDQATKKSINNVVHTLCNTNGSNAVDAEISSSSTKILEETKATAPRVYKMLTDAPKVAPTRRRSRDETSGAAPPRRRSRDETNGAAPQEKIEAKTVAKATTKNAESDSVTAPAVEEDAELLPAMTKEEAMETLATLNIPDFDAGEEENGLRACLDSSKWQSKKQAMESLAAFIAKTDDSSKMIVIKSCTIIFKAITRDFKESNFNVMLSLLTFFVASATALEADPKALLSMSKTMVTVAVNKLPDRKLSETAKALLTALANCTKSPGSIVSMCAEHIQTVKPPPAHEALLTWVESYVATHSAKRFKGKDLSAICSLIVVEATSSNVKVKQSALKLVGTIHKQLGIKFKISLIGAAKSDSIKSVLEKECDCNPVDTSLTFAADNNSPDDEDAGDDFNVPRANLLESLPKDIISKMGTVEGKNSWKIRKEAIETVQAALKKHSNLIAYDVEMVDLVKALNERISDSQSNLKPLSAGVVGQVVNSVEPESQPKLMKIVATSLITSVVTESKKNMQDAAMKSIIACTTTGEIDGSKVNKLSMEMMVPYLVSVLQKLNCKGNGLQDILSFFASNARHLANLYYNEYGDTVSRSSKQSQHCNAFIFVLLKCMTSATSGIRSEAEKFFKSALEHAVFGKESVEKNVLKLIPAEQRTVNVVVHRVYESLAKENRLDIVVKEVGDVVGVEEVSTLVPFATGAPERVPVSPKKGAGVVMGGAKRKNSKEKIATAKMTTTTGATPMADAGVHKVGGSVNLTGHPLNNHGCEGGKSTTKTQRISFRKRENWPEYPEEPGGRETQESLKKIWSSVVNAGALKVLFPDKVMNKQDDATPGITIIQNSVDFERRQEDENNESEGGENEENESIIVEQLDLIMKFLGLALCLKDNTTALQNILTTANNLFSFLTMKGDVCFNDVEAGAFVPFLVEKSGNAKGRFKTLFSDLLNIVFELFAVNKLAGIFTNVVEYSKNQKARVSALAELKKCVNEGGLGVIGKKGFNLVVKCLDGNMADVRSAALDIVEVVWRKFGGDKAKLIKACGSSLSKKAESMINDRLKRSKLEVTAVGEEREAKTPGIKLKLDNVGDGGGKSKGGEVSFTVEEDGPFKFKDVVKVSASTPKMISKTERKVLAAGEEEAANAEENNTEAEAEVEVEVEVSAAASLRARLAAIRDKSKKSDKKPKAVDVNAAIEAANCAIAGVVEMEEVSFETYAEVCESLTNLDDEGKCERALKTLHGCLTEKDNNSFIMEGIQDDVSSCVKLLAAVMNFAFGEVIKMDLLSVCLACLMAIFRNEVISKKVNQVTFEEVVVVGCRCLLDDRMSSGENAQLMKAINKFTIQVAVGSNLNASLQGLMNLQYKFSFMEVDKKIAKICSKLFSRSVKTESGKEDPFFGEETDFDFEELLASLEDFMVAVGEQKRESVCDNVGIGLLAGMIKGKGSEKEYELRAVKIEHCMDEIELEDNCVSRLILERAKGVLGTQILPPTTPVVNTPAVVAKEVASAEGENVEGMEEVVSLNKKFAAAAAVAEGGGTEEVEVEKVEEVYNDIEANVSQLIANVGSCDSESDKGTAMEKLRSYVEEEGVVLGDIVAKLSLSTHFKNYILGIEEEGVGDNGDTVEMKENAAPNAANNTVTDRLSMLKAKLAKRKSDNVSRSETEDGNVQANGGSANALRLRLEKIKERQQLANRQPAL